jgi:hypothetical protein
VALCSRRRSARLPGSVELPKQASQLSLFGLCEDREVFRDRRVMIRHQLPELLPAAVGDEEPVGLRAAPRDQRPPTGPPHGPSVTPRRFVASPL